MARGPVSGMKNYNVDKNMSDVMNAVRGFAENVGIGADVVGKWFKSQQKQPPAGKTYLRGQLVDMPKKAIKRYTQ
jgi:hypothetical protein